MAVHVDSIAFSKLAPTPPQFSERSDSRVASANPAEGLRAEKLQNERDDDVSFESVLLQTRNVNQPRSHLSSGKSKPADQESPGSRLDADERSATEADFQVNYTAGSLTPITETVTNTTTEIKTLTDVGLVSETQQVPEQIAIGRPTGADLTESIVPGNQRSINQTSELPEAAIGDTATSLPKALTDETLPDQRTSLATTAPPTPEVLSAAIQRAQSLAAVPATVSVDNSSASPIAGDCLAKATNASNQASILTRSTTEEPSEARATSQGGASSPAPGELRLTPNIAGTDLSVESFAAPNAATEVASLAEPHLATAKQGSANSQAEPETSANPNLSLPTQGVIANRQVSLPVAATIPATGDNTAQLVQQQRSQNFETAETDMQVASVATATTVAAESLRPVTQASTLAESSADADAEAQATVVAGRANASNANQGDFGEPLKSSPSGRTPNDLLRVGPSSERTVNLRQSLIDAFKEPIDSTAESNALPGNVQNLQSDQSVPTSEQLNSVQGAGSLTEVSANSSTANSVTGRTERPTPLLQQVVSAVSENLAMEQASRELTIRLRDPHVGELRIHLQKHDGNLSVSVAAADDVTFAMLSTRSAELTDQLRANDIQLQEITRIDSDGANQLNYGQSNSDERSEAAEAQRQLQARRAQRQAEPAQTTIASTAQTQSTRLSFRA